VRLQEEKESLGSLRDQVRLGRYVGTSKAAGEVPSSNLVPKLKGLCTILTRRLGDGAVSGGAVSMRFMDRVVCTGAGTDLANPDLADFIEVMDYDPVRHVALVVGKREAPLEIPILWLLHRAFPGAMSCAILPGYSEGEPQVLEKSPRGSFEEAMSVARALKEVHDGLTGPAALNLERIGLAVVLHPTENLEEDLEGLLGTV
jgi:hypothetical protein